MKTFKGACISLNSLTSEQVNNLQNVTKDKGLKCFAIVQVKAGNAFLFVEGLKDSEITDIIGKTFFVNDLLLRSFKNETFFAGLFSYAIGYKKAPLLSSLRCE